MAAQATSGVAGDQSVDAGATQTGEGELTATPQVPEDIKPLFFTTTTQQIFECTVDTDVTRENPWKLIKKEKILEDFKMRAAISDFHPAKQIILNYPAEELLVVYDDAYQYGQNFYLCISEEAKERVMNPPVEEGKEEGGVDEAEEEAPLQPPVSERPIKPWISLGSEKEIEEERTVDNRPLVSYIFSRRRKHFGHPVLFTDMNASNHREQYVEYLSYEEHNYDLQRLEKDIGVQAVVEVTENYSQTTWAVPRNASTQYAPRVMTNSDMQKAMESEEVLSLCQSVLQSVESALQQNVIMDVFADDFQQLADEETTFSSKSDSSLKEYQSFTDLQFSKDKTITCIEWHPTVKGVVAVSCAERLSFDERINQSSYLITQPSLVLIWSFTDPIHPQIMLEAPDDIFIFKFNPTNPNYIAGGCLNGQVVLWDISAHEDRLRSQKESGHSDKSKTATLLDDEKPEHAPIIRYCAVSSIEHGHTMCIEDLQWLPDHMELTRMGDVLENQQNYCNQLMTCATDGHVMIWDTRPPPKKKNEKEPVNVRPLHPASVPTTFKYLDLVWRPMIKIPLPKGRGNAEFPAVSFSIRERQQGPLWGLKVRVAASTSSIKTFPAKQPEKIAEEPEKPGEKSTSEVTPLDHVSTKFYVGTEDGEVVYISWKMEKDPESGQPVASQPLHSMSPHCGTVRCVQRSPFFNDILLTVGGWDFCIWKEGVNNGPLLKSTSAPVQLTGGHWSPSRAGVFFIARADGNIEVWDFLDRSHEPSKMQNVSAASITSIYPFQLSAKQQLLAVGDRLGTLHIVEIPWSYRHAASSEVSSVEGFFDREVKRLQYFDERARNRNIRQPDVAIVSAGDEKEAAQKEYDAYLETEHKLLVQLGLREEKPDD